MPTCPRKSAFVVLSIDPVASLEDLDGEDVPAICKNMKNKKYVACVDRSYPILFNPFIRYHTHEFYLLFQGLPTELAPLEELEMVFPIFPNTHHPTSSRAPLVPTLPLPWDDCYTAVFTIFEARVAVQITEKVGPHELSPREMARMEGLMEDDVTRREELYQVDHPGEEPPPLLPPFPILDLEEITASTTGAPVCIPESAFVLSETTPVITCTFDLSTVDVVNDPKDFFKEVEVLDKIRAEYKVRKDREIAEARRLDEEYFEKLTPKPPSVSEKSGPTTLVETSSPKPSSSHRLRKCIIMTPRRIGRKISYTCGRFMRQAFSLMKGHCGGAST